jgi:hypothetical protein
MPVRTSGRKAQEGEVEWKIISSSKELDGEGHETWTWADPAGVIFIGRESDTFVWKKHLSNTNVSTLSANVPVVEDLSPKEAFRQEKSAQGTQQKAFALWYLYNNAGLPILRGPALTDSKDVVYTVSAEFDEGSLIRYEAAEQAVHLAARAEQDAEELRKKQAKEKMSKSDFDEQMAKEKSEKDARKETQQLTNEAEEWRESLKQAAVAKRTEAEKQDAIHRRARKTLHRPKVKVALVPENPDNPTGALAGADVSVSATYHSEEDADRHLLAIADVSSSMEPMLPEMKSALKSLVGRSRLNAHLSLFKRVDEAKAQNVAEDRMAMKVGEIVSLETDISAIRIRCGWANANGVAFNNPCDLDGGIALYTDSGPYENGVCYFAQKKHRVSR